MAAWLTEANEHLLALEDLQRRAPDATEPGSIQALRDALRGSDPDAALLVVGMLPPLDRRPFIDLVVGLAMHPRHLERARTLLRGAEAGVVAAEIMTQARAALTAADDWDLDRLIEVAEQLALEILPAILAAAEAHDSPEIRACARDRGTEASLRASLGLPIRSVRDEGASESAASQGHGGSA